MKLYGRANHMIRDGKAVQLLAVFLVMGVQGALSTTRTYPSQSGIKLRVTRTTGCQVSVNVNGLPFPEPVILNPVATSLDGFAFKRPQGIGTASTLTFATGEKVRLACTGKNNHFPQFGTEVTDITVTCVSGEDFQYQTGSHRFSEFKCSKNSLFTIREVTSSSCASDDGLKFIEIGFAITPSVFVKIIDVCFDDVNLDVKWTRFDLLSEIGGQETGFKRPLKFEDSYFPFSKANDCYLRTKQRSTIAEIIGSTNANQYIQLTGNSFLSRGHLAASNDFIYNVQKLATYNLINVAPQWQNFNSQTWNTAETAVWAYVNISSTTQNPVNLHVYTGIHGNEKLPDDNGLEHDLYLNLEGDEKRIKVPGVFWKVVYEPESKKGIALIGVNNQLKDYETVMAVPGVDLCPGRHITNVNYWEICNAADNKYQIPGFGYCCEVDHIRNSVSFPSFTVSGILTVN